MIVMVWVKYLPPIVVAVDNKVTHPSLGGSTYPNDCATWQMQEWNWIWIGSTFPIVICFYMAQNFHFNSTLSPTMLGPRVRRRLWTTATPGQFGAVVLDAVPLGRSPWGSQFATNHFNHIIHPYIVNLFIFLPILVNLLYSSLSPTSFRYFSAQSVVSTRLTAEYGRTLGFNSKFNGWFAMIFHLTLLT